jgi:hypothetical protein
MGCGSSQNKVKIPAGGNINTNKETNTKTVDAETFPPKKVVEPEKKIVEITAPVEVKPVVPMQQNVEKVAPPESKPREPEKKEEDKILAFEVVKMIKVLFKVDEEDKEIREFQPNKLVEEIVNETEVYFANYWARDQMSMNYNGKNLRDLSKTKLEEISNGKNEIVIDLQFVGLPIAQDIIKEFSKISFIAKPLFDSNEIVIYDIKNAKMSVESLGDENIYKMFNLTSSYCNGADYLFLSGGENETEDTDSDKILSNSFLEISLNGSLSLNIMENEYGLLHPRKSHSMIYIPNEYVFIVGGVNCLNVEYYELKSKKFVSHSELNEERIEPALSLINNTYLYCFSGFKDSKSFERINLRSNSKQWESIEVKFDHEVLNFTQMFFAVSYYKNDSVIFLGGLDYENTKNNYAFNYNTDTLFLSGNEKEEFESTEKYFIPIQKSTGINLPNFYEREIKLLVWNNDCLEKADFIV